MMLIPPGEGTEQLNAQMMRLGALLGAKLEELLGPALGGFLTGNPETSGGEAGRIAQTVPVGAMIPQTELGPLLQEMMKSPLMADAPAGPRLAMVRRLRELLAGGNPQDPKVVDRDLLRQVGAYDQEQARLRALLERKPDLVGSVKPQR